MRQSELMRKYPDYEEKLLEICRGRDCTDCPLSFCQCPSSFTLEGIDRAYVKIFGRSIDINEQELSCLLGD